MISFSFIIPHKEIPELLTRCVKSVPDRGDIQLIVVDDNSLQAPDKAYFSSIKKYSPIEIIYLKESKGAGHARNIGLEKALGKWIIFADADDFFNPCLEHRLDYHLMSDSDLIFLNANSLDTDLYTNSVRANHLNRYIDKYDKDKDLSIKLLKYKFGEPWSKMVNKDFVLKNKIQFEEIFVHNDTMFSLLVGHYANKVEVDKYAVYCVTTRKGSLSYQFDPDKLLIRIDVFSRVELFYKTHKIDLKKIYRHYIALNQLFFNNNTYFKKGISILKGNGFNTITIYTNMLLTMPLYIVYKNKNRLKVFNI
ncbi:MAG: glycosyltransferase family 2 protein [Chitinophagaceae bacterium]